MPDSHNKCTGYAHLKNNLHKEAKSHWTLWVHLHFISSVLLDAASPSQHTSRHALVDGSAAHCERPFPFEQQNAMARRPRASWRRRTLLTACAAAIALASTVSTCDASSSSSSSSSAASIDSPLGAWYTGQIGDNETQLMGLASATLNRLVTAADDGELPCAGRPSIQSITVLPNGTRWTNHGCPSLFTSLGASCTCLGGYANSSGVWEFKVKKKTSAAKSPPLTLTASDVLEIDTIASLWIPDTVTTLRIIGVSDEPLPIPFVSDNWAQGTDSLPIAQTNSSTLNLQTVDLSNNRNMNNTYVGKTDGTECALCSVKTLYVRGNDIQFTVSNATFQGIQKLVEFEADDLNDAAGCASGVLQTAHNRTFCVLGASSHSDVSISRSNDSMLYIIIGCVALAALLVVYAITQRWWRTSRDKSFKDDERKSMFGDTIDYDDSFGTLNAYLLNDPLIITNRIPYRELKVSHCINKGGFGLVFVGEYQGRKVAVKKIRSDMSSDIEQIELFLKEITLMATLVHPRIVEFIGVAWDSLRHLSAVTEFMERGDLRDVLHGFKTRGCQLTWETHKTHISLHIAEALTYLHSLRPKKVIHRDLKSKNVLMTADLEAKLSDFGISRERRYEDTHMTAGIGTSFWIAPEVLMGKDYDEKADIFSFGVVLSEIDTDDYPYWNEKNPQQGGKLQQNEILRQVALGAIRPEFTEDCPEAILELADRCLQVNPDDRPTGEEIVYLLQWIQTEYFDDYK
ncbi:Tkl protein kinase, partial [Globisporangium splendens]